MWPDRVSNLEPLAHESDALQTAVRGPALWHSKSSNNASCYCKVGMRQPVPGEKKEKTDFFQMGQKLKFGEKTPGRLQGKFGLSREQTNRQAARFGRNKMLQYVTIAAKAR